MPLDTNHEILHAALKPTYGTTVSDFKLKVAEFCMETGLLKSRVVRVLLNFDNKAVEELIKSELLNSHEPHAEELVASYNKMSGKVWAVGEIKGTIHTALASITQKEPLNFDAFKAEFSLNFPRQNLFCPSGPLYDAKEKLVNANVPQEHDGIIAETLSAIEQQLKLVDETKKKLEEVKKQFGSTREPELKVIEGRLKNREANLIRQKNILLEERKLYTTLDTLEKDVENLLSTPFSGATTEDTLDLIDAKQKAISNKSQLYQSCYEIAMDKIPTRNAALKMRAVALVTKLEDTSADLSALIKKTGKQHPDEFYSWCSQKAQDPSDSFATNNLGWCHQYGIGVPKDNDIALKLYYEAVGNDFVEAFSNIAQCLEESGLPDYDGLKVYQYYELALTHSNNKEAKAALQRIGSPVPYRELTDALPAKDSPQARLAKAGFNPKQIEMVDAIAQQLLADPRAYVHMSKDKGPNAIRSFAITKRGGKIYIHQKKLGSGASKVAKLTLEYLVKVPPAQETSFARLVPRKVDATGAVDNACYTRSVNQINDEIHFLKMTKGREGIINARSVEDIKLDKTTGTPKVALLLDPYASDLSKLVSKPLIPAKHKLELIRQVCIGIKNTHDLGILHRDIKPANMLTNYDRQNPINAKAVVSDFDLALDKNDPNFIHYSENGWAGTSGYMAPEMSDTTTRATYLTNAPPAAMIDPHFQLGIKMDMYSLGTSIGEILLGSKTNPQRIVSVTGPNGTAQMSILGPLPPDAPPGLAELSRLVTSMIDADPWTRPGMDDVIAQLSDIIDMMDDDLTMQWA